MEIFVISFLVILIIILIFLLRKQLIVNETLLESNLLSSKIIANVYTIVNDIGVKLYELDYKGSFSSDDEIGWFFDDIKSLYNMLKDFDKVD